MMEKQEENLPENSRCTQRNFLERLGASSGVAAMAQMATKAAPAAPPRWILFWSPGRKDRPVSTDLVRPGVGRRAKGLC